MEESCLIVEGGGYKTSFTAGVLDAFIVTDYDPFTALLGVSGGAVAVTYFLSKQYKATFKAMNILAEDSQFAKLSRIWDRKGYMDIDYFHVVAEKFVPLDKLKVVEESHNKQVRFVATNRKKGVSTYLKPDRSNWMDSVIASCTLPFVTKGRHYIDGIEYFDGGWSDPIPIQWAYDQGYRKFIVLRTSESDKRVKMSWFDYFGSLYFTNEKLKRAFATAHEKYNESIDFIANPPKDVQIEEIAPIQQLKSNTIKHTRASLLSDYRRGLDRGLDFVYNRMTSIDSSKSKKAI